MTDMHTAASASGPGARAAGAESGKQPSHRWRVLRQPDVWIPLALLGVFLMLWALVLARPTFLTSLDVWVRDRVQDSAHADTDGSQRWRLVKGVADLGGGVPIHKGGMHVQVAMVMLGVVAPTAAAVRRDWRPLAAAAVGFAGLGLVLVLKAIGNRPGPSMAGQEFTDKLGYFPSGHTGTAMLCYGAAALILAFVFTGRWMRLAIAAAMALTALAVGCSLVWMDYHWLSDVLGSYTLCGAVLFVVARVLGLRISGSTTSS
jgi:undecaprenyl-diphosphatase